MIYILLITLLITMIIYIVYKSTHLKSKNANEHKDSDHYTFKL